MSQARMTRCSARGRKPLDPGAARVAVASSVVSISVLPFPVSWPLSSRLSAPDQLYDSVRLEVDGVAHEPLHDRRAAGELELHSAFASVSPGEYLGEIDDVVAHRAICGRF